MARSGTHLLSGVVEVDETLVGGREEGKPGRSLGEKKIVQVAVETLKDKKGKSRSKRAYGQILDGHSSDDLRGGLMSMASKGALVFTDNWPAYKKATKDYLHVSDYSDQGQNFQHLHWHIFNFKNWLRGTHHHSSQDHAQLYIDEFHFRFNRRNCSGDSVLTTIKRMMNNPWLPYKMAIGT